MGVKRPRNILSGPGRPLADRFPEGWRRALGYSWAVPFEAGTPENRDGISELEGRGNRCLLPIRPGQEGPDRGAKQDGRRQILAGEMANRESRSRWEELLLALRARGLHGVERGWPTTMPACAPPSARVWPTPRSRGLTFTSSATRSLTCRA